MKFMQALVIWRDINSSTMDAFSRRSCRIHSSINPIRIKGSPARALQVSDLDGTMVGDSAWADEATREFSTYWEHNAALCGGVLVYNTGRSLGQFTKLLEEKSGTLAVPNALITAVGTKVSRSTFLSRKAVQRGQDFLPVSCLTLQPR